MRSNPSVSEQCRAAESRESGALECAVTVFAACRYSVAEVNALRKQSATLPGDVGSSVLKHAEEQTLAGMGALRHALPQFDQRPDFSDWGVVCSSRYLGRSAFVEALAKFAVDGPWNVSVQVVPHRSLHSPASMFSLALGCHGPCVGAGGGLDGETDAWLTAMTLLDQNSLPGIWLAFLGWDPDELIAADGSQLSDSQCTALVLALQPSSATTGKAQMRLAFDPQAPAACEVPARNTAFQLFENSLPTPSGMNGLNTFLGGGLRLEMNWEASAIATLPLPVPVVAQTKNAA